MTRKPGLLMAIIALALTTPASKRADRPTSLDGHSSEAMKIKNAAASFRGLPSNLTVHVQTIPHGQQRYDTEGDWWWRGSVLEIRLSSEVSDDDPRYGFLLLTHELIEALLCQSAGVTDHQVDAFDMAYKGSGEPGDDPTAPYHEQHEAAQAAERALADALKANWRAYICGYSAPCGANR